MNAFTKPYCQMTAIDGLIVGGVIMGVFLIGWFLWEKFFSNP